MKKYIKSSNVTPHTTESFMKALKDKLFAAALKVMQTPEFGYDANEAREYTYVDVELTPDGDYIQAEVRAEVYDYDHLIELCEALDSIVEPFGGAYFEPVTGGIADAYIPIESIQGKVVCSSEVYNPPRIGHFDVCDANGDALIETEKYSKAYDIALGIPGSYIYDIVNDVEIRDIK